MQRTMVGAHPTLAAELLGGVREEGGSLHNGVELEKVDVEILAWGSKLQKKLSCVFSAGGGPNASSSPLTKETCRTGSIFSISMI